ncbi:hypothetical protein MLD38_017843 [Melastoma candidum]|uniref:Uncharacterized protein n=1 Tax=Melastoma candidum TaxID=119954 RepID=A0ACB9QTV7_9MYRT|nr:hypothetical protein MLD38_017843 [Melastoma candidum]
MYRLFDFACDNPPPATIIFISADKYFAPILVQLKEDGYNLITMCRSEEASMAFREAGLVLYDWGHASPDEEKTTSLSSGKRKELHNLANSLVLFFYDLVMSSHDCTILDLESLGLLPKSGRGDSPETPQILLHLSSYLEKSIRKNEKSFRASKTKDVVTIFHGTRAPSMSIKLYLERIYKYSGCSTSCFVIAYVYINRLLHRTQGWLTSLNIHRLLITGTLIASKFIDDKGYNNAHFAKVGGVSTAEINRMEINFLFSVDFRLHVPVEIFEDSCLQLGMEAACGHQRNDPSTRIFRMRECWPRREDAKRSTAITGFSCTAT